MTGFEIPPTIFNPNLKINFTKLLDPFMLVLRIDSGHHYMRWHITTKNWSSEYAADSVVRLMWEARFGYEDILQAATSVYSGWTLWFPPPAFNPSNEALKIKGINEVVTHPVNGSMNSLYHTIISLNDSHKWSRENIADWLDTLDIVPSFEVPSEVA